MMTEKAITAYIDEMIVLSVLNEGQADVYTVCERLSFLSGGSAAYNIKYTAQLLLRLKQDGFIKKTAKSKENFLTEKGKEELIKRQQLFSDYEYLLDRLKKDTSASGNKIDFEQAFGNFIDRCEYDKAENALFALVRSAFKSGWNTAGGKLPEPKAVVTLINPHK